LESFATLADGSQIATPRHYRTAERTLQQAHRRVSRRQQGSHRRRKAVRLLAHPHQKVRRARADFPHQVARCVVQGYDTIDYEVVQTASLLRNHHLAKSVADTG